MGLEDDSLMPYGKFKDEFMVDVPAYYLIWLYDNNKCSGSVKNYIEDCIEVLRKEIKQ